MNTLRITKGNDIEIAVNGQMLCFVTDFVAQEKHEVYEIEEMLSDESIDNIVLKTSYELSITALSHLDSKVFDKENFTITVCDKTKMYEYSNCLLKSKVRDVSGSKPVVDKYTIVASSMKIVEG